jgi:CRP-like cAMP-binding protein
MEKNFEKFKLYIAPFGLSDANFDLLIGFCEQVQFKKGDVVMKAGEKQNSIYLLQRGWLEIMCYHRKVKLKPMGLG